MTRSPFLLIAVLMLIKIDGIEKAVGQRTVLDDMLSRQFRVLRDMGFQILGRTTNDDFNMNVIRQRRKLQPVIDDNVAFICNTRRMRSKTRPTSVHRVRPGDIDVVAALGDSLTAANGATASNILQVMAENRGLSWSIGGQGTWRQFLTLPNILKEFNPKLIGYSLGDSLSYHKEAQFNVAEPASMSRDMPYMAKRLVEKLKKDSRVNVDKDWKLITMMIGGNDFCVTLCYAKDPRMLVEDHRKDLIKVLTLFRDELPRTIVNFVLVPNLKIIQEFNNKPPICEMTHSFECPCLFGLMYQSKHLEYRAIMTRWQQAEREVVEMDDFKRDDFAAVVQPFTEKLIFPVTENNTTDYTFLSEDCFHFSQKGYARAANALWNNMMEPVGNKSTNWHETFAVFKCPTKKNPFIYTSRNSYSNYKLK